LVLGIWWLLLLLGENPVLQTLEVDQTDRTLAFACNDQRVVLFLLGAPTDSALNLIFNTVDTGLLDLLETNNFLGLLQFLLVKLLLTHHVFVTPEIFDSESDPTKFDSVKFLNLIIVLSGFIFK
jgi:hypothetical protein